MALPAPPPLPATGQALEDTIETFVEPEAAVSAYMLFIEEVFCKKKKFFSLGKNKKSSDSYKGLVRKP